MEHKYILGADPGKHGAVVLYNEHDRREVICIPAKVKDGDLDVVYLWEQLLPYKNSIAIAVMEKVHALFGSSAAGTFSFGEAVGSLRALLQLLSQISDNKFEVIEVQPKIWQKVAWSGMDIIKGEVVLDRKTGVPKMLKSGAVRRKTDTKATSMQAAKELFPEVSFIPKRCRIVHDGCVDAALIAYYGQLYKNNKLNSVKGSCRSRLRSGRRASSGSKLKLP